MDGYYSEDIGVEKSLDESKRNCILTRITEDITSTVQPSETCQVYSRSKPRETRMQYNVANGLWISPGIDIFHLKPTHFLIIVDYYSTT